MPKAFHLEPFYKAIQANQYILIGKVKYPVGTQGAFSIALLDTIAANKIAKIPALFIEKQFTKVPYHIQNITITHKKIIIQCTHIQTKTEAYTLHNLPIYLPQELENSITSSHKLYNDLTNYKVIDTQGTLLGSIQTLYTGQMHNIISVNVQGQSLLIPYCPPFIVAVDNKHQTLTIDLPENYIETMLSKT